MGDLILYTSEDGRTRMQLRADGKTVWLTQLEIAELFQTTKQNRQTAAELIVSRADSVSASARSVRTDHEA